MEFPDFGGILSFLMHCLSKFQSSGLFQDHALTDNFTHSGRWHASCSLAFWCTCLWLDCLFSTYSFLKLNYQNLKVSEVTTGFRTLAERHLLRHRVQTCFWQATLKTQPFYLCFASVATLPSQSLSLLLLFLENNLKPWLICFPAIMHIFPLLLACLFLSK